MTELGNMLERIARSTSVINAIETHKNRDGTLAQDTDPGINNRFHSFYRSVRRVLKCPSNPKTQCFMKKKIVVLARKGFKTELKKKVRPRQKWFGSLC